MDVISKRLHVLEHVAEKLIEEKILFALGGECMLYLRGVGKHFSQIDILISEKDIHRTDALFCSLGKRVDIVETFLSTVAFYEIEDIVFHLMVGFSIYRNGRKYCFPLRKKDIDGPIPLFAKQIPLHSLSAWRGYYQLLGDQKMLNALDQSAIERDEMAVVRMLKRRYPVRALIVYGSFADGGRSPASDFDALVLTENLETDETDFVLGIPMDVSVRKLDEFRNQSFDASWMRYWGGKVRLSDPDGVARHLMKTVSEAAKKIPKRTLIEKYAALDVLWALFRRAFIGEDVQSRYALYHLLTRSLETYYLVQDCFYPGEKKALRLLTNGNAEAADVYKAALFHPEKTKVEAWLLLISKQIDKTAVKTEQKVKKERKAPA